MFLFFLIVLFWEKINEKINDIFKKKGEVFFRKQEESITINCLQKKHSVISLWNETNEMAKKENKTPVVALCESGRPGFWVMVHSDDLEKVSNAVKKKII